MTPLETLKAARELISVPERWTQKAPARDWTGKIVTPHEIDAFCWCSVGALERFATSGEPFRLLRWKMPTGYRSIVSFNDTHTHTHAKVVALFDAAIAELEAL